jgi:fatty-acyl-CoA synthase
MPRRLSALVSGRFFCRGQISRYKIPKYIHFARSYPLTASGKIQKFLLRENAEKLWPDA